jgi:hypothetical protein
MVLLLCSILSKSPRLRASAVQKAKFAKRTQFQKFINLCKSIRNTETARYFGTKNEPISSQPHYRPSQAMSGYVRLCQAMSGEKIKNVLPAVIFSERIL